MVETSSREVQSGHYTIGVMRAPVESEASEALKSIVDRAVDELDEMLTHDLALKVVVFDFTSPHVLPSGGSYSPFDFLKIGLAEKLERRIDFLLIVSEVDLSGRKLSYTLALPSQLMNIGIISTKRLSPEFWGQAPSHEVTIQRLSILLLHTLGHLLNLPHSDDAGNVMHEIRDVEDLDEMSGFTQEQVERIRGTLGREAREEIQQGSALGFVIREVVEDWRAVWQAVVRANPFRLITRLPTMLAAAGSAMVVVFFTAEIWDVAGAMTWAQVVAFSLFALAISTMVLYRAFSFNPVTMRRGALAESTVVTVAATQVTLLLTVVALYVGFGILTYLGARTIFPSALRATWTTVSDIETLSDHVKLSGFIAGVGVLAGSLGGRADSKHLVRYVLFVDEET